MTPKIESILLLNCQGFNPSAESCQKWKLDFLLNKVQSSDKIYPVIALTETWLKPCIADAQIHFEGYDVYRSDRVQRVRGGSLLYIKDNITVTTNKCYDDDICQAVFCLSPSLKLMLFCVYKPCDASVKSFSNMLSFISTCISECENTLGFTILILGDFNFPDMWSITTEEVISKTTDENNLTNFMNSHFLSQYINVPTRGDNILDLLLTNNDEFVYKVGSEPTILSDHNFVEILPSAGMLSQKHYHSVPTKPNGFQSLNLFDADFTAICDELSMVDWHSAWQNSSLEEFPKVIFNTVLSICEKFTPLKVLSPNNKLPKKRPYKRLLRKLKKQKNRLKCIESLKPSSPKCEDIKLKILDLKEEIKQYSFKTLQKKGKEGHIKNKKETKVFLQVRQKTIHSQTKD